MMMLHACVAEPAPPRETADTAGPPEAAALAGACPSATDLGGFTVDAYEDYTAVSGEVDDGVVPASVLTEAVTEGECALYTRENPYCSPSCSGDEVCDTDGTCLPYPLAQDLGRVTIAGLAARVRMDPVEPGNTYFDTTLPHPGFAPGDAVELTTEGADFPSFTLHGYGVTQLIPGEATWTLTAGDATTLTWDAPGGATPAAVELTLSVDQHGATPAQLSCTFADDGAGEVPAGVVTALVDAGVTGYPQGSLVRRTMDRVELDAGCADLRVGWVTRPDDVTVTGHTPCGRDEDCPEGQTCDTAIETCG
jgi:hypothetical protein